MDTKSNEQAMPAATPLRQALHDARVEAAERSAVIIELRDAEMARLQLLNEAIEPVFKDIPAQHAEFFDRGVSGGTAPRLWIDAVTHVAMGRDKRTYRLLTDTANGRRVLEESAEVAPMQETITRYVARKLVQREQALAATEEPLEKNDKQPPRRKSGIGVAFLLGALFGAAALIAFVLLMPVSN